MLLVALINKKTTSKTEIFFNVSFTVARLFTPKIASYYEEYYKSRGVNFIKGTVLSSFDFDSNGKVLKIFLISYWY